MLLTEQVLCEKPFGANAEEADTVHRLALSAPKAKQTLAAAVAGCGPVALTDARLSTTNDSQAPHGTRHLICREAFHYREHPLASRRA
jgi:hypothetical protein